MTGMKKRQFSCGFRIFAAVCFFVYLVILIRLIIFKNPLEQTLRDAGGWSMDAVRCHLETANLKLGHTIRLYLRYWERLGYIAFANLVYNVIAFIPFGIAVPVIRDRGHSFWLTFLSGTLFSAAIELTQLITLIGECDVDDVILNSAGVLAGWILYRIGSGLLRRIRQTT